MGEEGVYYFRLGTQFVGRYISVLSLGRLGVFSALGFNGSTVKYYVRKIMQFSS